MSQSLSLLAIVRIAAPLAVIAAYMANTATSRNHMAVYAVSAAFFVCSSAVLMSLRPARESRMSRILWAEALVATLLSIYVARAGYGAAMQVLFIPILVTATRYRSSATWGVAAGWLATNYFTFAASPSGGREMALTTLVNGCFVLFAGSAGAVIRTLTEGRDRSDALLEQVRESEAALQRAHRQLKESAARQQTMATLEERQRLAREIHDGVAHRLTVLIVQLQVGNRLLSKDLEKAASVMAECEDMAREALLETRLAVRALRSTALESQSYGEALAKLGDDFSRATGVAVHVSSDPVWEGLEPDPSRLDTVYRIFQEALTNAYRHGEAQSVRATFWHSPGKLRLTIANDGRTPDTTEPGGGLSSMEERARACGGKVRFTPLVQGFEVDLWLPTREEGPR